MDNNQTDTDTTNLGSGLTAQDYSLITTFLTLFAILGYRSAQALGGSVWLNSAAAVGGIGTYVAMCTTINTIRERKYRKRDERDWALLESLVKHSIKQIR